MARLYADENFPLPVVEALRGRAHDVLTTREAGNADQAIPDEDVLTFAAREARAILTLNRLHFLRLHRIYPAHSGIVVCTFDPDFARQSGRIDDALQEQISLAGQLLRINRPTA